MKTIGPFHFICGEFVLLVKKIIILIKTRMFYVGTYGYPCASTK